MPCSSPRLVVWCGHLADARLARAAFFDHLRRQVERREYALETGTRINKFTFACRSILDPNAIEYQELGGAITVLRLDENSVFSREHCGGELLFQTCQPGLDNLVPRLRRRDQTMTHFGFTAAELRDFAISLNGRGLDRLVPIGSTLNFEYRWDGYNLFNELTRQIVIRGRTSPVRTATKCWACLWLRLRCLSR
jgi:hypothetical protein